MVEEADVSLSGGTSCTVLSSVVAMVLASVKSKEETTWSVYIALN